MSEDAGKLRLDKWLWFARFFKTRTLAAARVAAGDVRVNGTRVTKRSSTIAPGDMLTFAIGEHVRVIEVAALGTRRGPAPEAQTLYTDHSAPPPPRETPVPQNPGYEGKGRPTKKDRRQADLSRSRHLE
ncbi:RNA-binding S4 domain-containing protein [uncultured Tateyamaria sp.]|uniref:RNA-binding S4 domain-containing protein n=1 Tax=Tateyamaria sp. 1078 TaxID=3417464 RepID=UPI0026346470|nr:RNA-binding S4 domain-containing protein [uncultured Tateyamaria sp.]